jgi:tripartite-type tricarboxylate transporter receptor subunit TctC
MTHSKKPMFNIKLWLFGALLLSVTAQAADYPVRAITVVVPFSAGSASDAYARLIGAKLATAVGQTVIIENRDGAGGLVGAQAVLRAQPDGHTLLFAASPWGYTPYFYKKPPYVPLMDFKPIAKVGSAPSILVAGTEAPFNDLPGMLAYAKKNPGKLTYSSSGTGTLSHLLGEYLNRSANIEMLHVPYKSTAQAMADVLGNQISVTYGSLSPALPQLKAQKLKPLGVTSAARAKVAPDIPTIASAGLPGFEASQWFGIVAPAGTPGDVVEKLNREINKVLHDPDTAARLEGLGIQLTPESPSDFTADIQKDIDRWVPLGKQLSISYE